MITTSRCTLFAVPKKRKTKAGKEYERLEAYTSVDELLNALKAAKDNGNTMVQVILRTYNKNSEDRVAVDMSFFEGKKDKES